MADGVDVHVLDSSNNMDSNVKNIFGIPQSVITLLENIGASTLDTPKWSVRVTDRKIYLDVAWDKSPAKNHGRQTSDNGKDTHAKPRSETRRKKKSPSTRRRDRLRLEKWKANKLRDSPACLVPEVQTTVDVPLDQSHPRSPRNGLPGTVQHSVENLIDLSATSHDNNTGNFPETVKIDPTPIQTENSDSTCTQTSLQKASQMTSFDQDLYNRIFNAGSNETSTDSEADSDDPDLDLFCTERCFNLRCMKPGIKVKDGLKKCTRCKVAQYCSRMCQTEHWPMHKTGCKNLAAGFLH